MKPLDIHQPDNRQILVLDDSFINGVLGIDSGYIRFIVGKEEFVGIPERIWVTGPIARKLSATLRRHARGRLWIDGTRYVCLALQLGESEQAVHTIAGDLTRREMEVARLISKGVADKEAARMLNISQFTVREHVRRIFHKLRISKRAAIAERLSQPDRDF
jgi:DNA-binding CsgD family transcriptional regulator